MWTIFAMCDQFDILQTLYIGIEVRECKLVLKADIWSISIAFSKFLAKNAHELEHRWDSL